MLHICNQAVPGAVDGHARLTVVQGLVWRQRQIVQAKTAADLAQFGRSQLIDKYQHRKRAGIAERSFIVGNNGGGRYQCRPAFEQRIGADRFGQITLAVNLFDQGGGSDLQKSGDVRVEQLPPDNGVLGAIAVQNEDPFVAVAGKQGFTHVLLGIGPILVDRAAQVFVSRRPVSVTGDIAF